MSAPRPAGGVPAEDLDHVLARTRKHWPAARGRRIFVTGATGFFGRWLLETFAHANRELALGAELVALKLPHERLDGEAAYLGTLAGVVFVDGDVRTLSAEELMARRRDSARPRFDYGIHAAIQVDAATYERDPLVTLESALLGTQRTLELLRASGARRVLLASSGAVYGRQPAGLDLVPEDFAGGPDPALASSAYAEGKRASETLCAAFARRHGLEAVIARGFSFVGPHLPLDRHFAIGNFLRDALRGGPIHIQGDGTPLRSYLYAADLAVWLWTLLFAGTPGRTYNVGSDAPISIADVARKVAAACSPPPAVEIHGSPTPGREPERYLPSIERARTELGLAPEIDLAEAIARTLRWHRTARSGAG